MKLVLFSRKFVGNINTNVKQFKVDNFLPGVVVILNFFFLVNFCCL